MNRFEVLSPQQLTEYIRGLRKSQGLTQSDVAKRLGVSTMRVATIEKDVGRLSTHRLITLLRILGAQLELRVETSQQVERQSSQKSQTPKPLNETGSKGEW